MSLYEGKVSMDDDGKVVDFIQPLTSCPVCEMSDISLVQTSEDKRKKLKVRAAWRQLCNNPACNRFIGYPYYYVDVEPSASS
jgi:hypothetical protein